MKIYYLASRAAFEALAGVEYQCVHIGSLAFGWIDWEPAPSQQAAFETLPTTFVIGHALEPGAIPAAVMARLSTYGVLATDTRWQAIQKVLTRLGGVTFRT